MNRQLLTQLQNNQLNPSVSILMPTHKRFPDNQQDKIRLKNLVNEAVTRLGKEFSKKETDTLRKKLQELTDDIDINRLQDGLAVFVNSKVSHKFMFPFPVAERVIIDKTFALRDIVFGYNRSQPYFVVILDEKNTRIFRGVRDSLTEVTHPDLPLKNFVHEIKDGDVTDSSYNDRIYENEERMKNFLREVDVILHSLINNEDIPFIIAGTEGQVGHFREVTKNLPLMFGVIKGNYGNSSASDIAKLVWPAAKEGFSLRRKAAFSDIENAVSSKKFATGIDEVWKLSSEGRGLTLMTETKYSYPAIIAEGGNLESASVNGNGAKKTDDAVDEIIENVVSKGGKVVFFEDGALDKYGRIALITRY